MVTISNVSVSPATPDLDDTITVSCDFDASPDHATVTIGGESADMSISALVGSAMLKAWKIGAVTSETVQVIAVEGANGDADTGTSVTISDTTDRLNVIRNAVYDELVSKSAAGQWFAGFTIEKYPPKHSGFDPKTIFIDMGPAPPTEYGLGSYRIEYMRIAVNLLFEERFAKTIGGSEVREDDLAQWFLPRVRSVLDEVDFGPSVDIDSRMVTGATHRSPIDEAATRYLYGCTAEMILGYKGGVT